MVKTHKVIIISVPIWALAFFLTYLDYKEVSAAENVQIPVATPSILSGVWPAEILAIDSQISNAAEASEIDRNLFAALLQKESWFDRNGVWGWDRCPDGPVTVSCTSVSGAIGPAQVMPLHFSEDENPRDLVTNLTRGAEILSDYITQKGSVRNGLAAYNCGPAGMLNPDCNAYEYADSILQIFEENVGYPYPLG